MPTRRTQLFFNIFIHLSSYILLGCEKLENSYEQSVLDCGPLPAPGSYVKVLNPDGNELSDEVIEVLSWQEEGTLAPLTVTAKACFLVEQEQDYIIRHTSQNAALRISSEQISGLDRIKLQVLEETLQTVQCQNEFISPTTNLAHWLSAPESELSGYRLRMDVIHPENMLSYFQDSFVSSENYSKLVWRLPLTLENGPYQLQFELENLLRGTKSKPVSCDVILDSQNPSQKLRLDGAMNVAHKGFGKAEPGTSIMIATEDTSPVQVHSCWMEVEEQKLDEFSVENIDCQLLATGPKLEVPGGGFWVLKYRSEDAAGNFSEVGVLKIFAFNRLKIEQIKLLSETVPYDVDKLLNPTRGAYKALYAETLKRQLATDYERKLAEPFARQALFDIVHKPIPFYEIESDERPYGMLNHPSDDGFMVHTVDPGHIRRFNVSGEMQWEQELGDLPVKSAFSKDGQYYAVAGLAGQLKIWKYADGEEIRHYERHSRTDKLEFNADGTRLTSLGYDNQVYVYDLLKKSPIAIIGGFGGTMFALTWHPDGQSFVISVEDKLYRYDLNGNLLPFPGQSESGPLQLRSDRNQILTATYLPSGHIFIGTLFLDTSEGNTKRFTESTIFDQEWQVIAQDIFPAVLERVSLSPDAERIALFGEYFNGIITFNNLSQVIEQKVTFTSQRLFMDLVQETISGIYWGSVSNRLVATSFEGPIYTLTDLGLIVQKIVDSTASLYGSAQINQSNNLLITGNTDKKIRFWNLEPKVFPSFIGDGYILHATSNPKGDRWLVIESYLDSTQVIKVKILDQDFKVSYTWNLPTPKFTAKHYSLAKGLKSLLNSIGFVDDRTVIFADLDGKVFIKNIDGSDTKEPIHFDFSDKFPEAVLMSFATFEGKILLGLSNGSVISGDLEQESFSIIENAHLESEHLVSSDFSNSFVKSIKPFQNEYPFLSLGVDGRIIKWDRNNKFVPLFSGRRTTDISPTGKGQFLTSEAETNEAFLIDDLGNLIRKYFGIRFDVNRVAYDQKNGFASAGSKSPSSIIYIWDNEQNLLGTFKNALTNDGISWLHWNQGSLYGGNYNKALNFPADSDVIYKRYCRFLDRYLQKADDIDPQVCRNLEQD